MPYSADNHNADKSDAANKVLTWNLAPALIGGSEKHMHAQFKLWHRDKVAVTIAVEILFLAAMIFFHVKRNVEESEKISAVMIFRRNVFAGLSVALILISAYMMLAPVTFADADIISAVAP